MITFADSSDVLNLKDSSDELSFTDSHPILVFNVVIEESTGFPYVFPYILS